MLDLTKSSEDIRYREAAGILRMLRDTLREPKSDIRDKMVNYLLTRADKVLSEIEE